MIKGSNVAPYLPRGQLDVIGSNVDVGLAGLVVDQIGSGKVAVFKKNAVDKVTIDENGDVRVYGNLTVNGTQTIINTDVGTTERLVITNDGTGPALEVNQIGNASVVDFKDDGVTALTIVNGGNVGIGTTNPLTKLDVNGGVKVQSSILNSSGRPILQQTGGVLQVVSANGVAAMNGTANFASLSITPTSSSSKIMLFASCTADKGGGDTNTHVNVTLRRGITDLIVLNDAMGYAMAVSSRSHGSASYIDSPASTNAITYYLFDYHVNAGSYYFYFKYSMTAMEIAG
jgi:hypothetical protein